MAPKTSDNPSQSGNAAATPAVVTNAQPPLRWQPMASANVTPHIACSKMVIGVCRLAGGSFLRAFFHCLRQPYLRLKQGILALHEVLNRDSTGLVSGPIDNELPPGRFPVFVKGANIFRVGTWKGSLRFQSQAESIE